MIEVLIKMNGQILREETKETQWYELILFRGKIAKNQRWWSDNTQTLVPSPLIF